MAESARAWPVNFDPKAIQPGTTRPLTELELAAVYVYLEKMSVLAAKERADGSYASAL